jgi:putative spermidine/putrescine transport system substrate-binding protein
MYSYKTDRRQFLSGMAALGGLSLMPRTALGAGKLVAATFGGTWAEVHKTLLAPYFTKRTGAEVSQAVMLATEQIAKLTAAKGGTPPFDVAILDEGPALNAIDQGLIAEYDAAKSPNFAELLPPFQDKWGPAVTMQCIGIAYNTEKIKTPPTSWDDLWDPKYKGRVGITSLASTLGAAFLVDINRLAGGNESDIGPAFEKLRTLLPNLAAVSANFGAHAALFAQGEVDLGVQNFNFTQTLKAKGVPVEFVRVSSGTPAWKTTMHVVAGAQEPDLAFSYVDSHLAADLQAEMAKEPWNVIPTNGKVPLSGLIAEQIAKTPEELNDMVFFDWKKINEGRAEWTDRFNKEIRV